MPTKPRGRSERTAAQPGPERDKPQTGESAAPDQEQPRVGKGSRRDRAWADFCEKLGAQASSFDPAAVLNQVMLMAACAPASSMFAANHADALMFYNAVANQQKTNILGMSVTAKCVRYMFEAGQGDDDDDIDILEQALDND
jgi:hypothetical protein